MKREELMIFVIDDDDSVCRALKRLLRSAGYSQVQTFACAEQFLIHASLDSTSLLILDMRMPGMDGIELHQRLTASGCSVPIVFISAHEEDLARAEAQGFEALAFLHKPFEDKELLTALGAAAGH